MSLWKPAVHDWIVARKHLPGQHDQMAHGHDKTYAGITTSNERTGRVAPELIRQDMSAVLHRLKQAGIWARSKLGYGVYVPNPEASPQERVATHEGTFVLEYRGNGEATKTIAQAAKQSGQQAAILWHVVPKGTPNVAPVFTWDLKGARPEFVSRVNRIAAEAGLPGWTWDTYGGRIRAGAVPQWQEPGDFMKAAVSFERALRANNIQSRRTGERAVVTLMQSEGENSYDRFIAAQKSWGRIAIKQQSEWEDSDWYAGMGEPERSLLDSTVFADPTDDLTEVWFCGKKQ